jgi:hypothetical protein
LTEIRDGPYLAGILETHSRLLRQLHSRAFLAAKAGKIETQVNPFFKIAKEINSDIAIE